jgi:hypothetical protein
MERKEVMKISVKAHTAWECFVQKVLEGEHGLYAVATSDEPEFLGSSITFSLTPDVWKERGLPEPGSIVVLSDVRKKRRGWRAHKAQFSRPRRL